MASRRGIQDHFSALTVKCGLPYYEQELFTKLQDAFLMECKAPGHGITVVHGYRSQICYDFACAASSTSGQVVCELADLRILAYSPSNKMGRVLLLQCKRGEEGTSPDTGLSVTIPDKEYILYEKRPDIEDAGRKPGAWFPKKSILRHDASKNSPEDRDMTMIAIFYESNGVADLALTTTNIKCLLPVSARTRISVNGTHRYKSTGRRAVIHDTSAGYTFCDYIPSLADFLTEIKNLEVGRPIDWSGFPDYFPIDTLFAAGIAGSEDKFYPNARRSDEPGRPNYPNHPDCPNIIFINVDELR